MYLLLQRDVAGPRRCSVQSKRRLRDGREEVDFDGVHIHVELSRQRCGLGRPHGVIFFWRRIAKVDPDLVPTRHSGLKIFYLAANLKIPALIGFVNIETSAPGMSIHIRLVEHIISVLYTIKSCHAKKQSSVLAYSIF